jgi:hypothetical protein
MIEIIKKITNMFKKKITLKNQIIKLGSKMITEKNLMNKKIRI